MVAGRDALRRPSVGSTSSSSGGSSYFDRYPERKGQGEYVPDQKLAMPRFKTLYRDGSSVLSGLGTGGSSSISSSGSTVSSVSASLIKTTSKRSTKDADAATRAAAAASRPALYASHSSTSLVSPVGSYSRYAPPPDAIGASPPATGRTSLSVDEPMRASLGSRQYQHQTLSTSPGEQRRRNNTDEIYSSRASSSSTSLVSSSASLAGMRAGLPSAHPGRAVSASESTSSLSPSIHYDTLHDSLMTGSKSRTRERLERQHAERLAEAAGATTGSPRGELASVTASRSGAFGAPPATPGASTTRSTSQRSIPSSSASSSSIAFVTSSSASTSFESFAPSLQAESTSGSIGASTSARPSASPSASSSSLAPSQTTTTTTTTTTVGTHIPTIEEIIARNSANVLRRPVLPSMQSAPHIVAARSVAAPGVPSGQDQGPAARTLAKSQGPPDWTVHPARRAVPGRRPSAASSPSSSVSYPAAAVVPPPVPPKGNEAVPSIDDIINSFKGSLASSRSTSISSKTPTPSTPRLVLPEKSGKGQVDEWGRKSASIASSRRPSATETAWSPSHARATSVTDSESDAASTTSMDSVEREVYASLRKARISESAPPDEEEDDAYGDDDASYFGSTTVYSAETGRNNEDKYGRSVEVLASPKSSSSTGPRSPGGGKLQSFVSLPRRRPSNSSLFSTRSQKVSSSAMSRGHSSPGANAAGDKRVVVQYSSRHAPRSRTLSGASSIRDGSVASTLRLDTAVASPTARMPTSPLSANSGGIGPSHQRTSIGPASPSQASPVGSAQEAALTRYLRSPRLTQLVTLLRPPYMGSVVSFADVGDPAGHPVVVFLGLGAVRYLIGLYDDMAKAMGLRLICVDRWGMGKTSDMPSSRRGIRPWAFVVIEVLNRLGIKRCSLLAHSAGAPYAMALALALREAADHQADPPPIEVAGPILLLAPWVSSTIDNGYKWLRYVPDSVIKTAQAAEWKMQGWKLGKPQGLGAQPSLDGQADAHDVALGGAGSGGGGSAPGTPHHSYDSAPVASPPRSAALYSPSSDSFGGGSGGQSQDTPPSRLGPRSKPNLLGSFFGTQGAGGGVSSSSGASRLSPSPSPSTGQTEAWGNSAVVSPGNSPYLPHHPRRAFSSNGDGDALGATRSRSSMQLWRSSSSVAMASSYGAQAGVGGGGDGVTTTSVDSDLSRPVEDTLGELRQGSSMALGGSGREKRSARIASWIASDSALAMLDGRLDASSILDNAATPSPSSSANVTPVLGSQPHHGPRGTAEGATSSSTLKTPAEDDPSLDLATALLRASHAESLKGGSADLLTILGRSSQQPWGFTYADVRQPTLVWHGDKDEKIGLNGALWMERHMERCELRIVQGAGHGLMTNIDVVLEALETARTFS